MDNIKLVYVKYDLDFLKFSKIFDFYAQSIYVTGQKKYFQDLRKVIRDLEISFYVPTMFSLIFSDVKIEKIK